jgi:hypothetical protein
MVLARQAIAQGTVIATTKISSKAIPVIGAVVGGATSFYFGSGVVKSCRAGFSDPVESWPTWLDLTDADAVPQPSKAVVAMRAAAESARDFGEGVWRRIVELTEVFRSHDHDGDGAPEKPQALTAVKGAATAVAGAAGEAAKAVGAAAAGAAGAVAGIFRRDKQGADSDSAPA